MSSEMIQSLLIAVVFGLVVGWLASLIVGGGGLIKYIIWGLLGSVVGSLLVSQAGIQIDLGHPLLSSVAVSTLGAVLLVVVARIVG